MDGISELANMPIKVKLCGKEFLISRLSIGSFFGIAESRVKEQRRNNALEIAKGLQGKEKMDFLMNVQNSMPKGNELNSEAMEWLNQPDGIAEILKIAFNKHQKLDDDEISNILLSSDQAELQFVLGYIIGAPEKKEDTNITDIDKKK